MYDPIIMTMSKEAQKGIAAGTLKRSGAVVRYKSNGQIFDHLIEATLSQRAKRIAKTAGVSALNFLKRSPIGFAVASKKKKQELEKKANRNVFDLNEYRRQKEATKSNTIDSREHLG